MDNKQIYLIKKLKEAVENNEYSNAVKYYEKAISFGACDDVDQFRETINQFRKKAQEENHLQEAYDEAMVLMTAEDEESINTAINKFTNLAGYKDSDENLKKCNEILVNLKENNKAQNIKLIKWITIFGIGCIAITTIILVLCNKNDSGKDAYKADVQNNGSIFESEESEEQNESNDFVSSTTEKTNDILDDNNSNSSQIEAHSNKPSQQSEKSDAHNGSSNSSSRKSNCENGHQWKTVDTQTIHHDEVGHYQTVTNYGNYVYKYKCCNCGAIFDTQAQCEEHLESQNHWNMSYNGAYKYTSSFKEIYVDDPYTTKEWIVDKKAYDEIITKYKCSVCGEEKKESNK